MASGAQPPDGSEPRAPGAAAALSPGGPPDAKPHRPPLSPPAPGRTPGPRGPRAPPFPAPPRGPRLPRRRASSEPAPAEARAPSSPWPLPCDSRGPLDERRLLAHLHVALSREARLWRGGSIQQPEIRDAYREVVVWLLALRSKLKFSSTTFTLALSIFGRLLVSSKVREGTLQCAIIACLRLAAKLNEEDESIPCVMDFIKHCGSRYSPNELRRMELSVLKDLHWDLHIATPVDFVNIFHALVMLSQPRVMNLLPQTSPSLHVASLTRQLQHCMAGHQLLQFKGSTLALVIITLEFERLEPGCCDPISDLLKKAQVSTEQYSHCKELVLQHLGSLSSSSQADN